MYLTETRAYGKYYSSRSVLFDSETNNVDVRFTSDHGARKSGFTLDVSTMPCSWKTGYCGTTSTGEVQDVMVPSGETLEGVISTPTESDGFMEMMYVWTGTSSQMRARYGVLKHTDAACAVSFEFFTNTQGWQWLY